MRNQLNKKRPRWGLPTLAILTELEKHYGVSTAVGEAAC